MSLILAWLPSAGFKIHIALLTLVAFILLSRRLSGPDLWIYGVIMAFTTCDVAASYLSFQRIPNHWVYNVMLIPQFLLVCAVFDQNTQNMKIRQVFGIGCILILVAHLVNLAFYQGNEHFANFTYIPATGWMAAYAFFFLRERMEIINPAPSTSLATWFALATLIDNAGSLPILSVLGWTEYISTEFAVHLYYVVVWLYVMWYVIILTGLLWTRTSLRSVFSSR